MSHFGTHAHRSRQIFASSKNKRDIRLELVASKATWSYWFKRDKAFSTKTDNRTYVQVVSHNIPCTVASNPCPKVAPYKSTVKKQICNVQHYEIPTSRVHVKRPLHIKSHHVPAPVLNSNSNWTFIALNLPKQEDSKVQQNKKQSTKFCVQGHNRGRTPRRTPGG